jgi:hypothetical protein
MLEPVKDRKANSIINNLVMVIKTGNMNSLSIDAYHFIITAIGFIAHYNIDGFREYYDKAARLKNDIIVFQKDNQWSNFHEGEDGYAYYMQRKMIYNKVCEAITRGY